MIAHAEEDMLSCVWERRRVEGPLYRVLWCEDSTLSFNIKIKVEKVTKPITLNRIWSFLITARWCPSFPIQGSIFVELYPEQSMSCALGDLSRAVFHPAFGFLRSREMNLCDVFFPTISKRLYRHCRLCLYLTIAFIMAGTAVPSVI